MLELVCRVYNINKGHNKELLERCKWLSDYMTFVDKVRECHKNHGDDRLIPVIPENSAVRHVTHLQIKNHIFHFSTPPITNFCPF